MHLFPSKCENKGKLKIVSTDNVSGTIAKSRSYKMKSFPKAVESGFMIAVKCLRQRMLLIFFYDLYNLREWQESQVSCLPFLSFSFPISTMNDFSPPLAKVVLFPWSLLIPTLHSALQSCPDVRLVRITDNILCSWLVTLRTKLMLPPSENSLRGDRIVKQNAG